MSGSTCRYCGSLETVLAWGLSLRLLAGVCMLVSYFGAWRPFFVKDQSDEEHEPQRGWALEFWRSKLVELNCRAPVREYAKIVIGYYQICAGFDATYSSVSWHSELTRVWQWGAMFSLDIFEIPGIACLGSDLSFAQVLAACIVFQLLFAFLLNIPSILLLLQHQA